MIFGGFSELENKTSDTDSLAACFSTSRVSQVSVITMKIFFEQRSELQVTKRLIGHALSSSYNVSSFELRVKKKTTQHWNFRGTNNFVLNQVRVYHERVYVDNVLSKFCFVTPFSSKHHIKFIANNNSKTVSQFRTKESKTKFFICKVDVNFLSSSRSSNCDTVSTVVDLS